MPDTILDKIKADHREASALLDEIIETEDPKARSEKFATLRDELKAHNEAEEKVLYARMKTKGGEDEELALEGEEEHDVADKVLAMLETYKRRDTKRWTVRAKVLKELLDHHIEEEEEDVFEHARDLFDAATLQKMGEEFETAKERIEQQQ
ncbi:MAG: hemerythrin domain-containing protein [Bauldia litoralis]